MRFSDKEDRVDGWVDSVCFIRVIRTRKWGKGASVRHKLLIRNVKGPMLFLTSPVDYV